MTPYDAPTDDSTDVVIDVPADWLARSQARPLKYFIPDWDDRVDPYYDFEAEDYGRDLPGWERDVYAHQLYPTPNYDGILVSREVIEKSKQKRAHLDDLKGRGGIHRYLRVPPSVPVMGDCGAFGYIKQAVPPYSTADVLDYYTDYGFDYGVSVDHLVVGATSDEDRRARYALTIENAKAFLAEHHVRGLGWTPMGAVQGVTPEDYARAAQEIVEFSHAGKHYDYLALGGLVRASTEDVLAITRAVKAVVPEHVRIHLFGIGRIEAVPELVRLGVRSIDSSSPLRQAWLSATDNYWTLERVVYTAVRIPDPKASFRKYARSRADVLLAAEDPAKELASGERKRLHQAAFAQTLAELEGAPLSRAESLRDEALAAVRAYDGAPGLAGLERALDALRSYEAFHLGDLLPDPRHYHVDKALGSRDDRMGRYRATLAARPWATCPCAICQQWGVDVAIFRGNNRNRRRGFHNTWVFYHLMDRAFKGEPVSQRRATQAQQASLRF